MDFPYTLREEFVYKMRNYELTVVSIDGTLTVQIDGQPVEDDDVYYWEGVVMFHNEEDWQAYTLTDVRRAAQACEYLRMCPAQSSLSFLIGYNPGKASGPDSWEIVKQRIMGSVYKGVLNGPRS